MSEEIEIAPGEASELLAGGAQALDVREEYEWDAGHIEGAVRIDLSALTDKVPELLDQDRPVVLYCRSGDRSEMAAEALKASGWHAHSIAGGLKAWADEGLPLEPESGTVAGGRPGPIN